MATIQQLFMNTVYYELSHIRDYHALVHYISQHYDDANSVQPMWKLIKQHKHAFKHKQTYEKLLSVVKHYVKHQAQKSEGFSRLIDNECGVQRSGYCMQNEDIDENEDGWIVHDDEEVEASSRAFYWRVNHNFY